VPGAIVANKEAYHKLEAVGLHRCVMLEGADLGSGQSL
jgi:HD superfamily phosphodiesterase